MNKTKGLLLAAGIVLATAFTFSGCKEESLQERLLTFGFSKTETEGGLIKIVQEFCGFEVNGEVTPQLRNYIFDKANKDYLKKVAIVSKYKEDDFILTDKTFDPYAETGGGYATVDRYYHTSGGELKMRYDDAGSDGMNEYITYYLSDSEYIALFRRLMGPMRTTEEVKYVIGSVAYIVVNGEMTKQGVAE